MIERIQEDERLRGDLVGEAAQQLVDWAIAKVRTLTDNPAQPDAEVEAQVQAVRMAARHAAQAGAAEPEAVVARAEAALATLPSQSVPRSSTPDTTQTPAPSTTLSHSPLQGESAWQRWRNRVRQWFNI